MWAKLSTEFSEKQQLLFFKAKNFKTYRPEQKKCR